MQLKIFGPHLNEAAQSTAPITYPTAPSSCPIVILVPSPATLRLPAPGGPIPPPASSTPVEAEVWIVHRHSHATERFNVKLALVGQLLAEVLPSAFVLDCSALGHVTGNFVKKVVWVVAGLDFFYLWVCVWGLEVWAVVYNREDRIFNAIMC